MFNLFNKKRKEILPKDTYNFNTETNNITYLSNYPLNSKSYAFKVNELEEQFFNNLYKKLDKDENSKITLDRMSNGTLNVQYDSCQIGRIKLQGRKHDMQIIYNDDKTEVINGNIDEFILKSDHWVAYILRYLKNV